MGIWDVALAYGYKRAQIHAWHARMRLSTHMQDNAYPLRIDGLSAIPDGPFAGHR